MEGTGLLTRAARIVSLFTVILLFAVAASAYTVVMRGGRRIEIPASFVVTKNTLTYEVSPGIQVTLALAAIDVAATEKANNEAPGGLLQRDQSNSRSSAAAGGTRTITNRDLEATTRRRLESEKAYEVKRKELGLPTLEESRKRAAKVPDIGGTELELKLNADKESELYWRARASAWRTETAALDAQLRYLSARLDEVSVTSLAGPTLISGAFLPYVSIGNVGHGHSFPAREIRYPNVFAAPGAGSQLTGRVSFGGGFTRGQVFLNPGTFPVRRGFGAGRHGPFAAGIGYGQFGLIGQPIAYSDERNALITRINELAAARAGLNAMWRELEEEARRAGASPGWLRR